jgi:hypothetical protein
VRKVLRAAQIKNLKDHQLLAQKKEITGEMAKEMIAEDLKNLQG